MARLLTLCGVVLVLSWLTGSVLAAEKSVTVEELAKRGEITSRSIAQGRGHVSWTTRFSADAFRGEVRSVISGSKSKRTILDSGVNGRSEVISSIIEQEKAWYVREFGDNVGRYRPFEAPLAFPNSYMMVVGSDLKYLSADTNATVQSVVEGVATLHVEVPARSKGMIQTNIDDMRSMLAKMGNHPVAEDYRGAMAQLEASLRGSLVRVDVASGVMLSGVFSSAQWEVRELSFDAPAAGEDLVIKPEQWKDMTNDPTLAKDLNSLLTIMNSPLATISNAKTMRNAADLLLVDVESRQVRRLPFPGPACLSGCFSKDRKSVYISGFDMINGGMPLYEIRLSTGESRRIDAEGMPHGMWAMPALSPDGTKLAVVKVAMNLESQLFLVDLTARKAAKLGKRMDAAYLSWLEDGKGLILITRQHKSMDEPGEATVCRMDLDGNVTPLIKGTSPALIPGRNRIMLQQKDGWKTCDLEGKDVELYAGGMKGHGFPAISPDGTRIVWMKFEEGRLPEPVLQVYGRAEVQRLDLGPGFWGDAEWK